MMQKVFNFNLLYKRESMFRGNKIYKIDKNGKRKRVLFIKGCKILFKGSNAVVSIHEPIPIFRHSELQLGDNVKIEIGASKYKIKNLMVNAIATNQSFNMGMDCSATKGLSILLGKTEGLNVTIGDDCMFGTNVILRTSDAHSIINLTNNQVENPGRSIHIGNKVWLGMNVTVLKGVNIADNTVVGTGSLVTKDCSISNAVYAGIPAKLIKTNVKWTRECLG